MRVNEKAYISGRISSQPWKNVKKAFAFGCMVAKKKGYEPISPLAGEKGKNWQWQDFMLDDLKKLSECSKMFVLGSPEEVKESYGVQIELLWARKLGIEVTYIANEEMERMNLKPLTEDNSFTQFMNSLPKWDGKDRVLEFENFVSMSLIVYSGGGCGTSCISKLIIEACKKNTDIVFCGIQGIGKSTLLRWLYPFEQTEITSPYHRTEAKEIPNGSILIETTHELKNVRKKTSYCYFRQIDLSYTQIDIKQLYAQVLAEAKEE